MMELIPAIDLRGGRVVRLFQGDFAAETRYELTPTELFGRYAAAGAARVHVVDLDGARDGSPGNRPLVETLAAQRVPRIQSGGGLRSEDALRSLFAAGVERAVIGSLAVAEPARVLSWFEEFGPERLVLALDVRLDPAGIPCVATHGWQEQSTLTLWQALEPYLPAGLQHVLCTDVGRDGALAGPNLDLYREAVARFPSVAWQASGGIRAAADLHDLAATGVAAAVSGKALIEGRIRPEELQPFLPNA
jgi:phosphoribosylformimino-5-aminoimidazole carboxamide ribotide isomerase